ncbi:MAG: cytochrome C biogenesis protein [Kiritimatiellaeota bacterium]|nr:cytochrome C biogenesis protein [Kiritimatiellota bacterium]
MTELFTQMAHAIEGSAGIALSAALLWGALSVLLSPCHLAAIPLIVGLIEGQSTQTKRTALFQSLLFSVGILASIAIIGLITAAVGRILGDLGRTGSWIAAIIFFIMGLQLMGVLSSPWRKPESSAAKTGFASALLTGLIFGIALGPCTFAFMAPVLAMTFKLSAEAPLFAWSLVLLYGLGHCTVIVLAGTSAEAIRRYLNWNENSKGAMRLRKVCGVLVLLAGLYLVSTAV